MKSKIKFILNNITTLSSFIALFLLGYIILITVDVKNISFFVSLISLIYGVSGIGKVLLKNKDDKNKKLNISIYIFNILISFLFFSYSYLGESLMPVVFGIYAIFNAFVKYIVYVLYQKDNVDKSFFVLLEFLMFSVIGVFMLFSSLISTSDIIIFIGVYCIVYSFTYFFDFLNDIFPEKKKDKYKRKFRLSPPMFLSIFIPYKALVNINKYFNTSNELYNNIEENSSDYNDEILEPDLEVLIHVTEDGYGRAGHMDIFYNGHVISYGNYDESSFRLFQSVGDGVIFFTDKSQYIDFCINDTKKTIFSFGLKLSNREKDLIDKSIENIMKNTYRWYSPIEIDIKAQKRKPEEEYRDYASCLYIASKTEYFKFKSTEFKTYFVLGTNCVLLCDTILGHIGNDIIKISGIITPGAYYDYFDREYKRIKSKVITKRVYCSYNSIEKCFDIHKEKRI